MPADQGKEASPAAAPIPGQGQPRIHLLAEWPLPAVCVVRTVLGEGRCLTSPTPQLPSPLPVPYRVPVPQSPTPTPSAAPEPKQRGAVWGWGCWGVGSHSLMLPQHPTNSPEMPTPNCSSPAVTGFCLGAPAGTQDTPKQVPVGPGLGEGPRGQPGNDPAELRKAGAPGRQLTLGPGPVTWAHQGSQGGDHRQLTRSGVGQAAQGQGSGARDCTLLHPALPAWSFSGIFQTTGDIPHSSFV